MRLIKLVHKISVRKRIDQFGFAHIFPILLAGVLIIGVILTSQIKQNLQPKTQQVYAVNTEATPPTVSFVSPQNNQVLSGIVNVEVNATDDTAVERVIIYVVHRGPWSSDTYYKVVSDLTSSPYTATIDTTKNPFAYTTTILARAYDTSGNTKEAQVDVSVQNADSPTGNPGDIIPPEVTSISPLHESIVSGTVTVEAQVSDNVGISKVELISIPRVSVGGEYIYRVIGTATSPPYRATFNSMELPFSNMGDHDGLVIFARAYDTNGYIMNGPNYGNHYIYIEKKTTGTITGIIFNQDKQPIPDAKISLTLNKQKKTYISDVQGEYTIPDVPPGTYTITYVAAGYSQQKTTATITAGQTLVINVTLKRK